jgi:hypothetical protein
VDIVYLEGFWVTCTTNVCDCVGRGV